MSPLGTYVGVGLGWKMASPEPASWVLWLGVLVLEDASLSRPEGPGAQGLKRKEKESPSDRFAGDGSWAFSWTVI